MGGGGKILIAVVGVIVGVIIIFYKPIEKHLIGQSENPTGFIGSIMNKIWNVTFENMINWDIDKVDIDEDDYILDVGCGGGKTIHNLASKINKGKVYGIDILSGSVTASIKKNKENIKVKKVEILEADVAELPFENNYFNMITAIQTHIYWEQLEKGFEEISRVLKRDGQFLLVCEKDKMIELLNKIGFSEVRIEEKGNWIIFICEKS